MLFSKGSQPQFCIDPFPYVKSSLRPIGKMDQVNPLIPHIYFLDGRQGNYRLFQIQFTLEDFRTVSKFHDVAIVAPVFPEKYGMLQQV